MTTQSTGFTDSTITPARKLSPDSRASTDGADTSAGLVSRIGHLVDNGKTHVREWQSGIQDGIRERPVQSILIAAAVGAAIGVILGRRSR